MIIDSKYLLYIVCLCIGAASHAYLHQCPVPEPVVETKVEYRDRVKTEIAYVPKETIVYKHADGTTTNATEKTDVDIKIPKADLNVKVNGKEFVVNKEENEEYIFDKNKLTLNQTSSTDINIKVPIIDNTRKWELGIGVSKNGVAGMIGYPIKSNVGGWIAGDKRTVMGGVTIKF